MKKPSDFQKGDRAADPRSNWMQKGKSSPEYQADDKFEKDFMKMFENLEPVEYPTQAEIESERKKYFSYISQSEAKAVSVPLVVRIKQMIGQVINPSLMGQNKIGKEKFVMSTVLVRIILIGSLLFGATTGAFAFTQNSLPDSPLYDAKLAIEDVSLSLMNDPAKLANRHLILARYRVTEMVKLAQKGEVPGEGVLLRLQQHLAYALHFAAQVQDGEMHQILNQAQTMAANQYQLLAQVQTQAGGKVGEPIGTAQQIMNQFQFQLAYGLGDPGGFKHQHQDIPDVVKLELGDCDPDCPIGDENKYGPQPDQPGPGQPGGNPDCPDCDPQGDQHQYGPQPEEPGPGPGQPGGNPDCPDCDPEGDENKNQSGKN